MSVKAVLLGCAQDGRVPQVNCGCERCNHARQTPGYKDGRVACLGLIDEEERKGFLIDATHDIASQLYDLGVGNATSAKLELGGILLTHAHTGHYTGLLQLGKEAANMQGVPVWCSTEMASFLRNNLPWLLLEKDGNIVLKEVSAMQEVQLSRHLAVTPVSVPHRHDITDTFAFLVSVAGRSNMQLFYCPDTDTWDGWDVGVDSVLDVTEVALLDGTFYSASELPGRPMSQVPHPLVTDTMARVAGCSAEVVFIHLNHTNPLLTAGSDACKAVEAAGMRVGRVDMCWSWQTCSGTARGLAAAEPGHSPATGNESHGRMKTSLKDDMDFTPALDGGPALPPDDMEVVDWPAAVEQCSGDEEFLKELLVDLLNESNDHMAMLREQVPKGQVVACGRIGHSIKGAAANLMCNRLRDAALSMERVGLQAASGGGELDEAYVQELLEASHRRLIHEMCKFESFLKEIQLI